MITKCEGAVQGSMRIVKADRDKTDRKERKQQQKHVYSTQKKQFKPNQTPIGTGTTWAI